MACSNCSKNSSSASKGVLIGGINRITLGSSDPPVRMPRSSRKARTREALLVEHEADEAAPAPDFVDQPVEPLPDVFEQRLRTGHQRFFHEGLQRGLDGRHGHHTTSPKVVP